MLAYKNALRYSLRLLTRVPFRGRYLLVENLRPLFLDSRRVVVKNADSLFFDLDLQDEIQRHIFFDLYDRTNAHLLCSLIQPGDIVFDIGGNVGFYTINMAKKVGSLGQVHTFEPILSNVQSIQRNVWLNDFDDFVYVNPYAVSDHEHSIELYISSVKDNTGWASVVPSDRRRESLTVRAVNLDSYILNRKLDPIRLRKMDSEGAELMALRGMKTILGRDDAPIIYIEINPFLLNKQSVNPIEIKEYLAQYGYKLFTYDHNKLAPVSIEEPEKHLRDILAIKPSILLDLRRVREVSRLFV